MKKKPTTPLSREAQAFVEMLTAERGASKNTEAAYTADLRTLETFLARRKQKPATADANALRAYLKSLDYVGMTPRTVARRLSVMRQLFRFLLAERFRDDDPASTLDSPRLGRPLPKVLSRAEVDRLIEAAQAKGRERFEGFVEALGRRLAQGRSLLRDIPEDIDLSRGQPSGEPDIDAPAVRGDEIA